MKAPGRLESQARLGQLINGFYTGAHEAKKKGQPIAWLSTASPLEIMVNMDFYCVYPEAHAATCGGRKVAIVHDQITEAHGYEEHLCTYARNDLGCVLAGHENQSPVGGLPKPDLLVTCNNSCTTIQKWFENNSRYMNVPLIVLDNPFAGRDVDQKIIMEHQKVQLLNMISFLEEMRGKKFDWDRFDELVKQSDRSARVYRECLALNTAIPAPLTAFDQWAHNFPNLTMRYTKTAEDHFKLLKSEIEQRVAEGVAAIPNEKYRVYWDGPVPWYALRSLSTKLAELGINVPGSLYSEVFGFDAIDGSRPLESMMALTGYFPIINGDQQLKLKLARETIQKFSCDGAVLGIARSCKPLSMHMLWEQDMLSRDGIPVVTIWGDLVDQRYYSEEETYLRFEALAEQMEARKKVR